MAKDLLLEIGTEEIPARFLSGALKELAEKCMEKFSENRIEFQKVRTYGTPRRLAFLAYHVKEKQKDTVEKVRGPAASVGFTSDGKPTKAALGFARSQGVAVEDLLIKNTDSGDYVFALKKNAGQQTAVLLLDLLPSIIRELSFPKTMRWGEGNFRFVRPIRWLLAVFGQKVIPFELSGLRAGGTTRGHRFLAPCPVEIKTASEYEERLERCSVIADTEKRNSLVYRQISDLARKEGGRIEEDQTLLEEVSNLLEYPTALCGTFDPRYLELPDEVLVTSMKKHQRYFPVRGDEGELLPKFIAVRDGNSDYLDIVRQGNEKVLKARLADASFFYNEDLKEKITVKVKKLDNVVFHEKLGTMGDKTSRLMELSAYIGNKLELPGPVVRDAVRAAFLSKADLVSEMVEEFPELQGIMGFYYAAHAGEREAVCAGIREHYLPRFTGDELPSTPVGMVLAVADKIDTIVGCFSVGIQPTGSQDPYALRRQALGVCHILIQQDRHLSLKETVEASYGLYRRKLKLLLESEAVVELAGDFFRQRLQNILIEKGIRYDIVNAILKPAGDDPADALRRARALAEFCRRPEMEELLTGYNRIKKIAYNARSSEIDPVLFKQQEEKMLWDSFQRLRKEANKKIIQEDYYGALEMLIPLRKYADIFFDNVMVMVDEEQIKHNRLAMLKHISDYIDGIACLSELAI